MNGPEELTLLHRMRGECVRCPLLQTHTARLLAPLLAAPASNLHFHSCPLVTEATVTLLRERVLASCGYRCRGSTMTLLS